MKTSLVCLLALALAGCGTATGLQSNAGDSVASLAKAKASQAVVSPLMARPTTSNNRVAVHIDREALPVLKAMLEGASKSIFLETFELHEDSSGKIIQDILIAKHRAGLQVRVILDKTGQSAVKSKSADTLREAGISVAVYWPFPYWGSHGKGMNITHRKLYLVDGNQAMTGGMNMGDKYLIHAHDMLWKVEGDAAFALHKEFITDWQLGNGKGKVDLPAASTGTFGNEPIGIAVTSPREAGRESEIDKVRLAAIDAAKTRIDTAYPFYFDDEVIAALIRAKARGVQVRVILTTHDKASMHKLNSWSAHQAMPKGVQFHWWDKSYAHIKYTAIDDAFLAIGSSNADSLTFFNNQELDLILTRPETVALFRAKVSDADWAATPEIKPEDLKVTWTQRPIVSLLEWLDYYL